MHAVLSSPAQGVCGGRDTGGPRALHIRSTEISTASIHRQRSWFLAGQACWFVAFGLQAVLFPFLVVNVLNESPERVGVAQMCLMAPALVLMIPGGMLADASDLRRLLTTLQIIAGAAPLLLAASLGTGSAHFGTLIAFALVHGSVQALILPTRDALLSRVSGDEVQRTITTAMAVQFSCQIVGFVLAGSASEVGAPTLLAAQAALYGAGALCAGRLAPVPPIAATGSQGPRGARAELLEALRGITHSQRIGPIMLIMLGVGFVFIAVFSVVVPIMVRDLYRGGSIGLALINGAFVAGVLFASITMMIRPPVVRQGRAIFVAASAGAVLTASFGFHPPMVMFYSIIFAFGIFAGVVMSLGRTVVQEAAEPHLRARVLAIYSLGFLGSAPLGAFVVGQVAALTGVLTAAIWAGIAMGIVLAGAGAATPIWTITKKTTCPR